MFGICCSVDVEGFGVFAHKNAGILCTLFADVAWCAVCICKPFVQPLVEGSGVCAVCSQSALVDGCASDHRWRLSARGYGSKSAAFSACLTARHHHHTHSHCCPHHILLHATTHTTTTNFPFSLSVSQLSLALTGQECRPQGGQVSHCQHLPVHIE